MILVGQSLELGLPVLNACLRARDRAPILERVRRQVEAEAHAIDVNGGVHADAADFAWCVRVTWDVLPGLPLLIDSASPALIAEVLTDCHRTGVAGPLTANAIPVRDDGSLGAEATIALQAAMLANAHVVLSPRGADAPDARPAADAYRIASAALFAAEAVRASGLGGTIYLDALAYPPLSDPARCRRSLDVLRAWRGVEGVEPLTAVGNVGYGADAGVAAALRAVYAAAAVGAGARALILPVEEPATVRAARLAAREVAPESAEDRWFVAVAAAARGGGMPPRAPEAYEQAARLVLGA